MHGTTNNDKQIALILETLINSSNITPVASATPIINVNCLIMKYMQINHKAILIDITIVWFNLFSSVAWKVKFNANIVITKPAINK